MQSCIVNGQINLHQKFSQNNSKTQQQDYYLWVSQVGFSVPLINLALKNDNDRKNYVEAQGTERHMHKI